LARLNFVFFNDAARFEESADRLATALATDISWIRQHTDFGEQARRWALANRPSGLLLRSPVLEQAERWIAARPRSAPAPTDETRVYLAESRHAATRRRNIVTGSLAPGWSGAHGSPACLLATRHSSRATRVRETERGARQEERDRATQNFKLRTDRRELGVRNSPQGLRNVQGMSAEIVRKSADRKETFEQLANPT
jgi:hypothetical protein